MTTPNAKPRMRCAYEDCPEAHPLANEHTFEQVTCLTCRAALGLPPTEIYKHGETVAAKPRAGEHVPDRFGLPEASYQDAMEMGNSLARAVAAAPDDFQFDERVLCRAFCLSAKEEILATQRWDTAAAERDSLRERDKVLVAAIEAALAYSESEAIGTVQQEIADNERMRQTLRNALEYGR